jgi:hypothetical protein
LNLIQKCHIPDGIEIHKNEMRAQNYGGGNVEILGFIEEDFKGHGLAGARHFSLGHQKSHGNFKVKKI